jgi:hypothetical protein
MTLGQYDLKSQRRRLEGAVIETSRMAWCGDEAVYAGAGVHAFAPPLTYATIAPPRTYGVRLRYEFGG